VQSNEKYSQLYAAEQAVRHVERGWLGVQLRKPTGQEEAMLDLPHGAVITKLLAQGPAFAGLSRFPSLALTDWLITGGQPALRGRLLQ